MSVRTFCDRCKREITHKGTDTDHNLDIDTWVPSKQKLSRLICNDCLKKLQQFLKENNYML
jgi:hypothetical protein